MAKTANQRLTAALTTLASVSQDASHFADYCLNHCRNTGDMSPLYGANYFEGPHNFNASAAQIGADLALGGYAFHTDERQLKRALRRAILLLKHLLNGDVIATSRGTYKSKSVAELREIILDNWRPKAVGEGFKLIGRLYGNQARTNLEGLYNVLTPQEQKKIGDIVGTGMYAGNTSADKFVADARAAILLLRRLSKNPAPHNTTTWLGQKKTAIMADNGAQLKFNLTALWRTYQDALPANIAMQTLLGQFVNAPLTFMQTHSIHATDGNIRVTAEWTITDMDTHPAQPKVVNMGFIKREKNELGALEVTYIDSNTRGTDMYFLPWFSKRITKMVIPQGNAGPKIFFTAAINGCSVLITGTDQAPVVYHGGVDGDLDKEYKDQTDNALYQAAQSKKAPKFWRALLKKLETLNDADIVGEVNRNHYVKDKVNNTMSTIRTADESTPNAVIYEGTVGGMGAIEVAKVAPWGCVFGLRHAATHRWSFYLQENVTVYYKRKSNGDTFATSRPIKISKIFPCNNAIAATKNYVNVPSNFTQVWDGTTTVIANPYDLTTPIVVKAPTPT